MLKRDIKIQEQKDRIEVLIEIVKASNQKAINYFKSVIKSDGSYGEEVSDICCYYKSPMMFLKANENDLANDVLLYIKNKFMTKEGDFVTSKGNKTIKPELREYWSYMNGWIVRASQLVGNDEISTVGCRFLQQFKSKNGFFTNQPKENNSITDILTTAHLGLVNLENNDIESALLAGNYLCDTFDKQPDRKRGIYLRINLNNRDFIKDFPTESKAFHFVAKDEPNQLYFMIGYPPAFLSLLYMKTNNPKFLEYAKKYLDFALTCHENVFISNFSHKLAWALSLVYSITSEEKYLDALEKIVNHFIKEQGKTGLWYENEEKCISYDQSAEIACWFSEVEENLTNYMKNDLLRNEILLDSNSLFSNEKKNTKTIPEPEASSFKCTVI